MIGPVVEEERPRGWLYFDHGQAAMLMQVAAADLGIGSSHSAVGDQDLAREILGHPADRFCLAIFSLGYPLGRAAAAARAAQPAAVRRGRPPRHLVARA